MDAIFSSAVSLGARVHMDTAEILVTVHQSGELEELLEKNGVIPPVNEQAPVSS